MYSEITDRLASRRLLETYADELQVANDRLTDSNRELAFSEQHIKYLIQEAPGDSSRESLIIARI